MDKDVNGLSPQELAEICRYGIDDISAIRQYSLLKKGIQGVELIRPARVNDGIISISRDEKNSLSEYYSTNLPSVNVVKFIPASGAASRMFSELYIYLDNKGINENIELFFNQIERFAFFDQIRHVWEKNFSREDTLRYLLSSPGLDYGSKPKGFFPFHKEKGKLITPVESHIREAVYYSSLMDGKIALHFTFSPEYVNEAKAMVNDITGRMNEEYGIEFSVKISVQSTSTDTISLDENGNILRDENGSISFRPGGHGSLLKNIMETEADLLFIRNIDNILPPSRLEETIFYKKVTGGLALKLRNKQFDLLHRLESGDTSSIENAREFLSRYFFINAEGMNAAELFTLLYRPLRVCGMVPNAGEPGGGPFWVRGSDGSVSLQIIESGQVINKDDQQEIFRSSTHFNPVDMVCSLKDHKGQKFNLFSYIDHNTSIISSKNVQGKIIRIIEHPGLWNGSMAHWLTSFTELPVSVFNPVKTVMDLLKPVHLSS